MTTTPTHDRADAKATGLRGMLPTAPAMRLLTAVTLVNTLGNGLFYTTSALFFTRSVGLTAQQLGAGLAAAGICGITAGPPLGWLADRLDMRWLLVTALAAEGVVLAGYVFAHSFATFLPLVCVFTFLDRGGAAVRNALVAAVIPRTDLVRARAYLRAVTNVGIGAGAAIAAVALQSDTRGGYLAVVLADAATFVAAAALLLRLRVPAAEGSETSPAARTLAEAVPAGQAVPAAQPALPMRRNALADPPYLLITVLNGVLSLQFGVLQVGVPLWVVRWTSAPRWIVSAILVINTIMVVFLQVRASRGTADPWRAARICRRSGLLLALGCIAYGYSRGIPAEGAVALLLTGAVIQTLGEVLSSAGGWALSYELADPAAHGAYQGVFNSGFAAGMLAAPLVVTSTAIRFGAVGWLAIAALFGVTGAAFVPATRWACRRLRA